MLKPSQHISHFLIGIPASGKSTLAHWLQAETQGQIISTDQMRQKLYGDATVQGDWADVAAAVHGAISEAIATQQTIIYDATNVRRQWRAEFLHRYNTVPWVAWQLQTPLMTCLQRNQRRSRQVPTEILREMAADLLREPPHCDEGFARIIAVPKSDRHTFRALKKQHLQYLGD